ETFSILISVLDGKGYISNSGVQGQRGYDRPIIFNWLGATTPLPRTTFRLMSQLGNRLLFYSVRPHKTDEGDLLKFAKKDGVSEAATESQKSMNAALLALFRLHPVGTVAPEEIRISDHHNLAIVRCSMLLVKGRAELTSDDDEEGSLPWAKPHEAPYRVIEYLKELAR